MMRMAKLRKSAVEDVRGARSLQVNKVWKCKVKHLTKRRVADRNVLTNAAIMVSMDSMDNVAIKPNAASIHNVSMNHVHNIHSILSTHRMPMSKKVRSLRCSRAFGIRYSKDREFARVNEEGHFRYDSFESKRKCPSCVCAWHGRN